MNINLVQGIRRQGTVVNIAAAGNGNALALLTLSTFASMVGNKTLIVKRLKIRNNAAGNTYVHIGTGVAGSVVDIIPPLYSVSTFTDDYEEFDLPQVEVLATIMAYVDAVGGGSFDIQLEAEEKG
jgi:hypothetical protein